MDVAGEGEQLGLADHLNGLFPHRPGGGLQVQFPKYRDHKDVIFLAGSLSDQGLAHGRRIFPDEGGHTGTIHCPIGVCIVVGSIGHLFLVQYPHDIGLFLGHGCIAPVIW